MPVYNCTAHFREQPKISNKSAKSAKVAKPYNEEAILTQSGTPDPRYRKEIPQGAYVCVHSTATVFTSTTTSLKTLSFNLLAVQILALPKGG